MDKEMKTPMIKGDKRGDQSTKKRISGSERGDRRESECKGSI
jgi:hypothetical protein